MPETDQNIQEPSKNVSKIDKAIDLVVSQNPGMPKGQIANEVIALGSAKHKESVFRKLRKRDYKVGEIGTIRDYNRQYLDRIIVPDALKVMKNAIKSKDLPIKDKQPWVKLAVDKSFGEIRHTEQPQVVHIDAINNAQFVIKQDLESG